jgi:hypothetical protein
MQTKHIADRLELLSQGQIGSHWHLSSRAPLAQVLAPGFFERFQGYALRLADRIDITAHYGEPQMQFARVVVTGVDKGDIRVTQISGGAL